MHCSFQILLRERAWAWDRACDVTRFQNSCRLNLASAIWLDWQTCEAQRVEWEHTRSGADLCSHYTTLNLMFSFTFTKTKTKFLKRLSPQVPAVIIWTVAATWRRRGAAGVWCSHIKRTWTRLPLRSPSASWMAWLFTPCCMRCTRVLWFRPSVC